MGMADIGIVFIMETSVIEDMIINCVALSFILSIDEIICTALTSSITQYMVEKLEAFPLFETADEEDDTEKDAYDKHQLDKQWNWLSAKLWLTILPIRFLGMILTTSFFI